MATTYEQTTTVHSTKVEDDIRPDPDYVKTIPGILKIVEIVSYKNSIQFFQISTFNNTLFCTYLSVQTVLARLSSYTKTD